MYRSFFNSLRLINVRLFSLLIILSFCISKDVNAHQTPTTIILMDVSPTQVAMELQLPLPELELSFGHDITKFPGSLVAKLGPQLKEYLMAHIHAMVKKDYPWLVRITDMKVGEAQQAASGPPFREITVHVLLIPNAGESTRRFILDYDVIMHQVVNHAAFVSVRNDWELGKTGEPPVEVGVIRVDGRDNVIYPFEINLEKGSWWKGFKSMVSLGVHHIAEGTDHLLFLLTLLLPATLLVDGKHWGKFGGMKYSLMHLLKIITAFTSGHSITLIIGALGWVRLPTQPVEILIAFSILISAAHAIRPIFPGKEIYIASGFGLIHGLAFASVLANLNLGAGPMALSILGFNIGIELMQLFVVLITVPWLIILSKGKMYNGVRTIGAVAAAILSTAWIIQRVSQQDNPVTELVQNIAVYAPWLIIVLALLSLISLVMNKKKSSFSELTISK